MFQEYFRGKNYELMQRKDKLMDKIKDIKLEVDRQNLNAQYAPQNSMENQNTRVAIMDPDTLMLDLLRNMNEF